MSASGILRGREEGGEGGGRGRRERKEGREEEGGKGRGRGRKREEGRERERDEGRGRRGKKGRREGYIFYIKLCYPFTHHTPSHPHTHFSGRLSYSLPSQ